MTSRLKRPLGVAAALAVIIGVLAFAGWHMRQRTTKARMATTDELVEHYADVHQLPPDLVSAVIRVESAGKPKAESSKGAKGLMQVTDIAEREVMRAYDVKKDVVVRRLIWIRENPDKQVREVDLFDPEYNIAIGTAYLRLMVNAFDGDTRLALAAYNWGPTKVRELRRSRPNLSSRELIERHAPGETRRYCRKIFKRLDGRHERLPVVGTSPTGG